MHGMACECVLGGRTDHAFGNDLTEVRKKWRMKSNCALPTNAEQLKI